MTALVLATIKDGSWTRYGRVAIPREWLRAFDEFAGRRCTRTFAHVELVLHSACPNPVFPFEGFLWSLVGDLVSHAIDVRYDKRNVPSATDLSGAVCAEYLEEDDALPEVDAIVTVLVEVIHGDSAGLEEDAFEFIQYS